MQSEAKRDQQALLALIQYQPLAAALLMQPSRFEQMAWELSQALRNTSGADLATLLGTLTIDASTALVRRVTGIMNLCAKFLEGVDSEGVLSH